MEFLNISYLSKVNIASLNGSEGTGGNVTPIKKVSDNEGNGYAYISGQAQRRYLKDTLMQLGHRITGVNDSGEPDFLDLDEKIYDKEKSKFVNPKLMYEEFCDLDLFGYMLPKGGRRWSPVKVSPMVSIYPYRGEYDYLTRKQYSEASRKGNIVQVEIDTMNFMRGNILIDADKIGKEVNEYTYAVTEMLDAAKIKERRNAMIDAVKYFNGGAKQSRNMEDISPKFVVAVRQKTGNPFLLNAVSVDSCGKVITAPIIQALEENKDIIESAYVGMTAGIFAEEEDIKAEFEQAGFKITTVYQALDSLKEGI